MANIVRVGGGGGVIVYKSLCPASYSGATSFVLSDDFEGTVVCAGTDGSGISLQQSSITKGTPDEWELIDRTFNVSTPYGDRRVSIALYKAVMKQGEYAINSNNNINCYIFLPNNYSVYKILNPAVYSSTAKFSLSESFDGLVVCASHNGGGVSLGSHSFSSGTPDRWVLLEHIINAYSGAADRKVTIAIYDAKLPTGDYTISSNNNINCYMLIK